MITEFFHQQPRAHAYGRLSSVMNSGTVSLRGAVCYVTEEGCRLLEENIERFKTKDSFFIAGYNDTSAIPEVNRLCELAPGKFYFHGIAAKGSEDWEGPLIPGLMHSKLIYAEGDTTATVWVGSHNLTHNALHGVNIESATITTGDRNNPFFQQVRRHLDAIRAESFLGPAAIKKNPLLEKPIRELVLIHCEASEEQIPRPLQIGVIGKKGDPRMGRQGERIYSTHGHAITFSAYGGGLAARTGAYLIQTANGTKRVRTLTPKECARVMGFERKKGKKTNAMDVSTIAAEGLSDWQLYKQFGNSVVVQTVEIIFKLINRHFFPKKKVKESLSK